MSKPRVELTNGQLSACALIGSARTILAREQGRTPRLGGDTFAADIMGAAAELAVALVLDVPWQPNIGGNDRHARGRDVAGYQVRATAKTPGALPIRDYDEPNDVFVLVCGAAPSLYIAGWTTPAEARQHDEWRYRGGNGPPCYFVPETGLYEWETLPFL